MLKSCSERGATPLDHTVTHDHEGCVLILEDRFRKGQTSPPHNYTTVGICAKVALTVKEHSSTETNQLCMAID